MKTAPVGVALNHNLDKGAVDHIHLRLAVTVGEVRRLAAYDAGLIGKVSRHGPVESNIGEGRLRAPAAGCIDAVYKAFDAMLNLVIGQFVRADKGRKIGVKARKRLCTCPFILHNAEEVDHLIAQRCQMLSRCGGYLAGNAAESLFNELL